MASEESGFVRARPEARRKATATGGARARKRPDPSVEGAEREESRGRPRNWHIGGDSRDGEETNIDGTEGDGGTDESVGDYGVGDRRLCEMERVM